MERKMAKLSFSFITDCDDATSIYDIRINGDITVKELIDRVLSEKKEWGYIIIDDKRKFEYRYGKVVSNKFTDKELNYVIKNMIWTGGWSRSDYVIFKDKQKPKFNKKH